MVKKSDKSSNSEFAALFGDAKPVKNDKYVPPRQIKKKTAKFSSAQKLEARTQSSFEFSDGFVAHFNEHTKVVFQRTPQLRDKVKALKRGLIVPEIELDLHGLTKTQAKREIAAVIDYAHKQHIECIKIVHGVSGGVLKQHTPNWLIQHPLIDGFAQAPKQYGGQGAIVALVSLTL